MDQKNSTERVMIDLDCRSKSPVSNSTYASFLMVVYGENALLQYCEWPLGNIVCEAVLLYRGLNKTLMVERPVFTHPSTTSTSPGELSRSLIHMFSVWHSSLMHTAVNDTACHL